MHLNESIHPGKQISLVSAVQRRQPRGDASVLRKPRHIIRMGMLPDSQRHEYKRLWNLVILDYIQTGPTFMDTVDVSINKQYAEVFHSGSIEDTVPLDILNTVYKSDGRF